MIRLVVLLKAEQEDEQRQRSAKYKKKLAKLRKRHGKRSFIDKLNAFDPNQEDRATASVKVW